MVDPTVPAQVAGSPGMVQPLSDRRDAGVVYGPTGGKGALLGSFIGPLG